MGKEIWMEYILLILHPTPKITELVLQINLMNLHFSGTVPPMSWNLSACALTKRCA